MLSVDARQMQDDRRAWGRTVAACAAGILVVLLLLEATPLVSVVLRGAPARLVVYSIPQVLALALPVGFLLGTCLSLVGRLISRRVIVVVVSLAIVCSVVLLAMIMSLVPAANRAFRAPLGPGAPSNLNEMTFGQMREARDAATHAGPQRDSRRVAVYYYTRWSLSFAPLALAALVLSVVSPGPVRGLTVGATFCGALLGYYVLMQVGMAAGLGGTLPEAVAAWLPNIVSAVVALVARLRTRSAGHWSRGLLQPRRKK